MRFVTTIIYTVILIGVIFMGALLFLSLAPVPGDFDLRVVQSGSMEPAIKTGSVVLISPTYQYEVGEVITFVSERRDVSPITHRIIAESEEDGESVFVTKGDANDTPDLSPVREDDILGRVLFSVPHFGYILDFARKPFGFILLILLPVLLVAADEIRKIVREVRKRNHTDARKDSLDIDNENDQ